MCGKNFGHDTNLDNYSKKILFLRTLTDISLNICFDFSPALASRKQQQIFDIQNLMRPNWWAIKDMKRKKVITNDNFYIHEPNMASLTQLKAFLILLPMLWKKP